MSTRINLLKGRGGDTRRHLRRCSSCGRATAAPLTCGGRHHHCSVCREQSAVLAALADAVAEADARAMIAALMQRPAQVY